MFKALGPRDLDGLNSQEIIRLAIYVIKRSPVELADPVLCEKVHTEGEKKRASAAAAAASGGGGGALRRGSSAGSSRKGTTTAGGGGGETKITASSIYLTKDFDIGNSVLHHRSKRPSRAMESVLSIGTFCARASRPSPSQARRTSGGSRISTDGDSNNNSTLARPPAAMVGAKWLAKLGQVVFGGPCAQAGHSHHRRRRASLDMIDSSSSRAANETTSNSGTQQTATTQRLAPNEKLCKHCSGAMTCLAISILRESSFSTTETSLSSSAIAAAGAKKATIHDSGFESAVSGLDLLDAQSDDVASDTSSSSSLSPPPSSSSQPPAPAPPTSMRHAQISYSSGSPFSSTTPGMNEDHRPRLELKNKTRTRREGSTPSSPFIVFDRSHQNDQTIRHPLESDTYDLQEQDVSGFSAWSPTSSIFSDSIAEEFGPGLAAGGDYRSNRKSSKPRIKALYPREDDGGGQTPSRLERDLAEALGTPALDSPSSVSPFIAPLPPPLQPETATAATLAPAASIRKPSVTGLGIHAPVRSTDTANAGDSDEEEVFHQATDHFIHPLSTSPLQRMVPPRTAPLAVPGVATKTTAAASSPAFLEPSPSNYSSPPTSPTSLAALVSPPTGDVSTPIQPPVAEEDEKDNATSSRNHPFYTIGIHGRASVDEYAQEVEESMQHTPPVDLGHSATLAAVDSGDDRYGDGRKNNAVMNAKHAAEQEDTNDPTKVEEVGDVDDDVVGAAAAVAEDESLVVPERRLSSIRYGAVGLYAQTPSDEYAQDVEESIRRSPPIDLGQKAKTDGGKELDGAEGAKDVEKEVVETNDEIAIAAAVERVEEEFKSTDLKNHQPSGLFSGVVGLHDNTPVDEYAYGVEESIQRVHPTDSRPTPSSSTSSSLPVVGDTPVNATESIEKKDSNNKASTTIQPKSEKPRPSTINTTPTPTTAATYRPLSSVSTGTMTDSSLDDYYDDDDPNDDDDLNDDGTTSYSNPRTSQTAIQKELQELHRSQRRRRRVQLVDDAQRKKEQLDRIQAQLERKTLGKIREQVSFWETKGVLEQKVVAVEEVLDKDDEENKDNEESEGGGGESETTSASATDKKSLGFLSLSQEHLRGAIRKSTGEPLSPGNDQSPGHSDMPQLAPRRSLLIATDTDQSQTQASHNLQSTDMDAFLSNVD
ncbi:hypothetical protein BGX23_012326 [Mortierella sp. AD031]|nr:hypothetical protein BGX23_012326 [Mortierella sp. AD031]